MNKLNTRSIGINTDPCTNCLRCSQEGNCCSKFGFMPFYIPFHYPICNGFLFPHCPTNFKDILNPCCKCENKQNFNQYLHNSVQNCSGMSHAIYSDKTNNIEEQQKNEEKTVECEKCKEHKKINSENATIDQISSCDITKYADEYLEKNYKPLCANTSKTEQYQENNEKKPESNDKHLLNHLLTPNIKRNTTKDEQEDESDDENDFEDENVANRPDEHNTQTNKEKHVQKNVDNRRPQRINISDINNGKKSNQNKTHDVEMMMMLKALVNEHYDDSNSRLNKLLNHIDFEENQKQLMNTSPRKKNKSYSSIMAKSNENKKS